MEFYGVIGEKLCHSLSPKISNEFFKISNIEASYKTFEISKANIKNAGEAMRILDIKGANVTIPYKEEVIGFLDYISPEAEKIGAVNTIKLKDNKLYGYNTDYYGFGMLLDFNEISVERKRVAILGTGGAAKACITYLLDSEVEEIYLVSRQKDLSKKFHHKITLLSYDELKNISGDVLVNTTPVGMYPNVGKSPVEENIVKRFNALVDIIYNPRETEFLRLGNKLGKKTCNGLYMLVGQAMKSQEIWQENKVSREIVDSIYEELDKQFK